MLERMMSPHDEAAARDDGFRVGDGVDPKFRRFRVPIGDGKDFEGAAEVEDFHVVEDQNGEIEGHDLSQVLRATGRKKWRS